MCIKIEKTDSQIIVVSDYNKKLPEAAKEIGGRWNASSRAWVFDSRVYAEVKSVYESIYGYFDEPPNMVTLICVAKDNYCQFNSLCGFSLHGRPIASASGRDSGAKTSTGIIVLEGGFDSGGSVKNWKTEVRGGTKIKVLDVPLTLAKEIKDNPPEWIKTVEIEYPVKINLDELKSEREKLFNRIMEIDKILKGGNND